MNSVTLIGRLGKDPELKTTSNGKDFCTFSLATTEKYKDEQKTQWHNCKAFGNQAKVIAEYMKKGDPLVVLGSIEYSEYDGKWYTNIMVQRFEFVPGGKKSDVTAPFNEGGDDDGLPF